VLDPADTGLREIRSLFVPSHATLEVTSVHDGVVHLEGRALVPRVEADARLFWHAPEDSLGQSADHHRQVEWVLQGPAQDVKRLYFHRDISFVRHHGELDAQASDPLMAEYCQDHPTASRCACYRAHQTLKDLGRTDLPVNHFSPQCQPDQHWLPREAVVGPTLTHEHCKQLYRQGLHREVTEAFHQALPDQCHHWTKAEFPHGSAAEAPTHDGVLWWEWTWMGACLVLQGFLLAFWFHWVYPRGKDTKVDLTRSGPYQTP